VAELLGIYVCRRCGRTYSVRDYEESQFCRSCGTFLLPESKVSKLFRKIGRVMRQDRRRVASKSEGLPENYDVRESQVEFIEEASKAIRNGGVFLGSAPCGIGKSLAALLAVLPMLEGNKLMICFRTRNQLDIFLKELKALNRSLSAVSFFSKQSMCPRRITGSLSYLDFFEECKRLKENCESSTKPFCRFYWKNMRRSGEAEDLALDCARLILAPRESVALMSKHGFCAYEALKKVLGRVNIFLGTYHYVFNSEIRRVILNQLEVDLSKVYLIVDEAHNLPAFSRELLSDRLTRNTVERALKETERFEHAALSSVQEYLKVLNEEIFQRAQRTLKQKELKHVEPQKISDIFLDQIGVTGLQVAEALQVYGEYVKEMQQELGYERVLSSNSRVGEFMENFLERVGKKYIHLFRKDWQDRPVLEVRSFDGREVTDPVLQQARGSILMSGCLSPPKVYRDLMLYDGSNVCLKEFDSPFPSENRLVLAAKDVSSKFKERTHGMLERWKDYIVAISRSNYGNIAFFFTSYELMRMLHSMVKIDRNMIVEDRGTKRNEVIRQLTRSANNALFGVMGAKLSEGMDYPNNLLTCVVTIGLPYATWSVYQKALIKYYSQQFPGNGQTYAYLAPAILRLVQTCGRVHRSARDKGCIVILDERVTHPSIKQQLPSYYQKEIITIENAAECAEKIRQFWRQQQTQSVHN
jgi:DNA excision repair protein ERCC-2